MGIDTSALVGLQAQGHAVAAWGNDISKEPADRVPKLSRTVRAVSIAASGIPVGGQYSAIQEGRSPQFHTCQACHFQSVGTPINSLPKAVFE